MAIKHNNGSKKLAFSEQWDILGPFQVGTREATWGADPLERLGGFCSLEPNPYADFHSSLAPNGLVSWTRHTVVKSSGSGFPLSPLACPNAVATKLVVEFPNIDWQSLQATYGWVALQWQAWARGSIGIIGDELTSFLLYIDNVLEFWVDDQHYFGGDMYGYRRAPLVLRLRPGDHTLNIRLVRDVRSMGGVGQPNVPIQLKAEVSTSGLVVLHESLVLPETVSGIPTGHYGSVNVLNTSNDSISIRNIEWSDPEEGNNSLTVDSWGLGDVEAAINAVPLWIKSMGWNGPSADIDSWLVSGHSNGDKILGAAPVSGYASIQGYVPYELWHEADPKATSIVQTALRSYRHELLLPNFSGIPVLQQHGSADDNVPVFHSRRLNQLICQKNQPGFNRYYEVHGGGHWYDGVMTTEPLREFYEHILSDPGSLTLPSNFSIIVVNPADMGPRGGLVIEQLRSPDQLGRMDVVREISSSTWILKTLNIIRFAFEPCRYLGEAPSKLVIDGQSMGPMSKERLLSHCFACANDGSWGRQALEKRPGRYGERQRSQMGSLDAILRSSGRFVIQAMSHECAAMALQTSRNFFQYFAADTEIIGRESSPQGKFTLICIGKGREVGWINQQMRAIKVLETCGVSLERHDGTHKTYEFEEGMGAIFLSPLSNCGLELIIWGLDDCGLRQASRLLPMLTGVGQPDFIVVRKRCAWQGAAGVLAMGSFNNCWKASEAAKMAAFESTGSPTVRGRASGHFTIHEEEHGKHSTAGATRQVSLTPKHSYNTNDGPTPLSTSKLGNLQAQPGADGGSKKLKVDHRPIAPNDEMQPGSMDALLAKLSEQQALIAIQKTALSTGSDEENIQPREGSSSGSTLLTPASDSFSSGQNAIDRDATMRAEAAEVARLKKELDAAKDRIARQNHELNQSRVIKQSLEQTMGSVSDAALSPTIDHLNVPYTSFPRQSWGNNDDTRSEISDINAQTNVWRGSARPSFTPGTQPDTSWGFGGSRAFNQRGRGNLGPVVMSQQHQPLQQRNYSVPVSPPGGTQGRAMNDFSSFNAGRGYGHFNAHNNRNSSAFAQRGTGFDIYAGPSAPSADNVTLGGMNPGSAYQNMGIYQGYQPQPIGTPLSPTANEFRTNQAPSHPWNAAAPSSPNQTYISPMEPLNYRRLLDRSVTCNWKYIVDKIVCNNDQQASIFLQQKLKVGTVEQKYEIIEAIVAQAYPLMVNRFGNFLVQRCFEHGTPEQVVEIANAIRGNTLSLSMDAFGCHVVQKAFDAVPEEYKAVMVHELLRRIPETVIHRYACHVWQKLFELRWSDSPPQIMKFVNEALHGMWHEVALGETGSLVVQNIFENCLEEDKRPCINEVLNSIDIVAHGQFGNWCIQHICEHGAPSDRSRAIDHVLRYATEYSMDQFASKVVEKCLKIGGSEFLERYLDRVCEGRADRPRIPLIDSEYRASPMLAHADAVYSCKRPVWQLSGPVYLDACQPKSS
ncbi:MAG: hypothetical protein Q9217_002238 [Psora testacea]